ncbi:ABC transporter ATP-binding protein [Niallia sp. FSL W8-0635]|uniref:ABC transporter ATP-binding protein n=1 Tax=Niallia sp. FSL W8-0635 TaxID=2975337 RepID=UPI0030F59BEF
MEQSVLANNKSVSSSDNMEKNTTSTKVEIKNLTKQFGESTAVNNANLTIESGEFMTFLGPSGCGKTTILSMVLGTLEPTSGDILFNGHPINHIAMNRRDIGMVFQNYALFPHMTVSQNIAFGLDMRKVEKKEKKRRVQEAVEMVQLNGLENRFIKELSGGQQQRVALARALVIRPKVLLLDEPLSNLDAKLRKDMRIQIKKIHDELAITTIYVTHDQEEALSLSTKIAVMSKGEIQQLGTPKEIFGKPKNHFVANFLGYANFIKGKIVSANANNLIFESDTKLRLEIKANGRHQVGDDVLLTIKPEMIEIVPNDRIGSNVIEGEILVGDYVGSTTGYEIKIKDGSILKTSVLGLDPYTAHQNVKLYLNPDNIIILDEE